MNKQISYSTRTAVKRKLAFISCLCVLTGRLTPTALGPEAAKPRTDQRLKWLQEHSAAVSSIDPSDTDFSDLMPLAAAIGPARVVLLGEQTHGDGARFLAKTRLIRFLHEIMGFDVLAWKADMYACREMDAALHSTQQIESAAARCIYPV